MAIIDPDNTRTGMPNGLRSVGYAPADVDALVAGALSQRRVAKLFHRPAGPEELSELFRDSMKPW